MSPGYAALLADVARRCREAEVLVADDDGSLVGCVTFVPDASSPWAELLGEGESGVRMLAVRPDAQGRGTGRCLLAACVDRARQLGSQALLLHTTPWMTTAHCLYLSSGFVRFEDRDWLPVPDVPLMAFRLELRPPG